MGLGETATSCDDIYGEAAKEDIMFKPPDRKFLLVLIWQHHPNKSY